MAKKGRDFEEAVYQFIRGLDPKAEILFDQKVPDADTGSLRQVDVWAKARVLGGFPITILVSCKDHRRRLSVTDIDTFLGEKRSTGASYGIIFSRGGFSANAVTKAAKHEIQCCELLDGQQPTRITDFSFHFYAAYPQARLYAVDRAGYQVGNSTWGDFLKSSVYANGRNAWLSSHIAAVLNKLQSDGLGTGVPIDRFGVLDLDAKGRRIRQVPFNVIISNVWDRYRARAESYVLWGALNRTESTFTGSMASPALPTGVDGAKLGWIPMGTGEKVGKAGVWMVLRTKWTASRVQSGVATQPIASNIAFGPAASLPDLDELVEKLRH